MLKMQELREIIRLIDQSSINEFTYEQEGSSISIKKSSSTNTEPKLTTHNEAPQTTFTEIKPKQDIETPAIKQPVKEEPIVEEEDNENENIVDIISPMVGTFYRKPSPESDTYVEVGDHIKEDSIVCIVEAMKLFNEIEAETNGEVVEILVGDGELVEYGQALFKVKTK